MKRSFGLAALVALAAVLLVPAAQAVSDRQSATDTYIVVLKTAVDSDGVAAVHAKRYGIDADKIYSHALHGYSASMTAAQAAKLATDPNVAFVEIDGMFYPDAQVIPWGIETIGATESSQRAGDGEGAVDNVNVYVIDSGSDVDHPDLNVVEHVNFVAPPNDDCNGHGTHVSGTIAARDNDIDVVGIVPGAPIHGVKVFECSGGTPGSIIIDAIDWVTANAIKPAVANMSLGGHAKRSMDVAVQGSANTGIFYAVAAGNSGADACTASPARAGQRRGVATAGATDVNDNEANFSNFGRCVDIWAPGVNVLSTAMGGGPPIPLSGTSMASPHVAGAGALYLSTHPDSGPKRTEVRVKANWTKPGTKSKDGKGIRLLNVRNF